MTGLAHRGLAPASRSGISLKVLLPVRESIALDKLDLALVDGFTGSSEPRGMPEYPLLGSIKVQELKFVIIFPTCRHLASWHNESLQC